MIEGRSGEVRGNNTAATRQPLERDHAGLPGGASIWYRWTAPGTGEVTIDTDASSIDTILAVYTGTSLGDLHEVPANDDAADPNTQHRVLFAATEGTTYRIAVDGYHGQTGDVELNWQLVLAPDNDVFDNAEEFAGASGTVYGHNLRLTREENEPQHAGRSGGASVWYRWTAPASREVTIDAGQSTFPALLGVYKGASMGELVDVVPVAETRRVVRAARWFSAIAGTEYRIAVDGDQGTRGEITLGAGARRRMTTSTRPSSSRAPMA